MSAHLPRAAQFNLLPTATTIVSLGSMAKNKGKGKAKAKASADNASVSSGTSGNGIEPASTKGKGNTTRKLATPIRLSKDAFLSMLRMAESKIVAEDLAKKKGNKIFEEMNRNTGTVESVDEA
ncbi:unnamed protein product [Rhizoctonia solani]|uniref:Uncharacterized protein n=1 Tax=Rhizoctonia solani TaxID=456999 RepID=A0A8H3ARB4_9AGAM